MISGSSMLALGQQRELELARLLANERTHERAMSEILKDEKAKTDLLLSWAEKPPPNVDQSALTIGLIDAFAKLRTKEAIPFLIKCLSISRIAPVYNNPWMKTPEVIQCT